MRKPIRFRHFLTLVAAIACTVASAQNMGINATPGVPPTPDANAILDIDVSGLTGTVALPKRGLLIPRMTGVQRLAIPVVANDNGLLVYQTDTGAVNDPGNQRGFWYYSTAAPAGWVHLSVARTGWFILGNTVGSVIAPFPEHLGTANLSSNKNLVFRTVLAPAAPAMQMGYDLFDYLSGFVGLGTPAPAVERLEVQGAIRLEKNATLPAQVVTPTEGTIRYGTKDGLASSATNFNWHWGTNFDTLGVIQWSRLENAEKFVTPPKEFPKDTVACTGAIGDAFRGFLSPTPVTQTAAPNTYSPFATNFTSTVQGNYRVQYLYRYSELVAAGLCFPATIDAFSFYCLDQETLNNVGPPVFPTTITGEVRGGAAVNAALANLTSGAYGTTPGAPFMDDAIRLSAIRGSFSGLIPSPGWVTFTLSSPIVLAANNNLILDIVWTRNVGIGVGPRVELEDPGFNCTKWVMYQPAGGGQSAATRNIMDDNPVLPAPTAVVGPGDNGHTKRPVTRFTGTVVSPTTKRDSANYIQYDGGLMVGSPAWLAGATFHGAGTIGTQHGVYDAGVLLSDHVFDRYFDGAPRPDEAQAVQGYAYVGLGQLRERLERDRHLPNMPSRTEWEAKDGASLGTVTTGLWETVEDQALYITQLEKDLRSLEEMAFGTDMSPQEAQRLITEVQSSKRLSEAQKLHLIDALNEKATSKP
ncbi:MAG: hypothetical protein IPP95_15145 [Flavobacteriales bacterium]|nr:MAG: hypothetical protein IPP95_15145 [Flavobacteriales bacterium]